MSSLVILDTTPLGCYATAGANPKNQLCLQRVNNHLIAGDEVRAPGIAVYENRRKLVHNDIKTPPAIRVARLDAAVKVLGLLPTTDEVLEKASEIWGMGRSKGVSTAHPEAIDGDVIVVAHAAIEARTGRDVKIATANSSDIQALLNLGYPGTILNWDDLSK